MLRRALSRYGSPLIAVALILLLAALAALQHRWIGQVSAMHRHRMQMNLLDSGSRFTEDFDREVTRAWFYFHLDPRESGDRREWAVRQYERWMAQAPRPRLIGEVYYIRLESGGGLVTEALRPDTHRFEPVPWPADFDPLLHQAHSGEHQHGMGGLGVVAADIPALVIAPFGRRGFAREGTLADFLILRLDSQAIAGEILPALTRRYFGDVPERDYSVAVVSAAPSKRMIYRSDSDLPAASLRKGGDASLPMFGVRPFEELREIAGEHWRGRTEPVPQPHGFGPSPPGGAWRLVLVHRNGTLDQAVTRFRYHNMAISGSILALLAVATVMMVVTTQRAQKLARQQIELVAGVTHELNTPITALRSAGQNLADGVVADPAQVKKYGALIVREGRRLSQMVGLMLEMAGLDSGQATYTLQPTAIGEALDGAIEDCRWLLDERQARVEKDIDPALPAVLGDAGALRRALRNLVENAAKYGGRSPWIGVRARADGGQVQVTVEDRGPGIGAADLPHLFEPFYRGREVKAGGIPGSGLGLSVVRRIVEAHHGKVSVESPNGAGEGSAFTLHLPAAPEGAA
ncbi:MAG: sensor histidine kinase [Thermoanaerobaculia bacterium]